MRTSFLSSSLFRHLCFLICFLGILVPSHLLATDQTQLGFDARCFTKQQCTEMRAGLGGDILGDGLIKNSMSDRSCSGFKLMHSEIRDEDIGFCIAGKKIQTTAGFGGRREFDDIPDFIAYIFRISFSIATALAVVMIVVAGIQWMGSGGNGSIISSAKSRISNALLGLFLLALSYTILHTVNPGLVSFRPLEIYLVNPIETAPEYCSGLETTPPLYLAAEKNKTMLIPYDNAIQTEQKPLEQAHCGEQFYMQNAGEQTCRGDVCPGNETCVPFELTAGNIVIENKYSCINSRFMISIKNSAVLQSMVHNWNIGALNVNLLGGRKLEEDWITAQHVSAYRICKNNSLNAIYMTDDGIEGSIYDGDAYTTRAGFHAMQINLPVRLYSIDSEPLKEYYVQLPDDLFSRAIHRLGCHGESDYLVGIIIRIRIGVDWGLDRDVFLGANSHLVADPNELLRNNLYIPTTEFQSGNTRFFYQYRINDQVISDMKKWSCLTMRTRADSYWNTQCI